MSLKRLIYSVSVTLIAFLLLILDVFAFVDFKLWDVLYQTPKSINPDIVFIAIDEQSLKELGKYEDWDRSYYATVLNNINDNESNRPAVIGVDVIFSGVSSEIADQALVEACEGHNNIVLASKFKYEEELVDKSYVDLNASLVRPYTELAKVATTGFTNATTEKDDYVRKTVPTIEKDGFLEDSFAFAVYKKYAQANNLTLPKLNRNQEYYFDYYSRPGKDYTILSFSDVYKGTVPNFLSGTIVLIGAYDSGFQDDYFVPSSNGVKMNGVEIHANIIESFYHDSFYLDVSKLIIYISVLGIVLLLSFVFYHKSLKIWSIIGPVTIALYFASGFIARKVGYFYPIVTPIIMIVCLYFYEMIREYIVGKKEKLKIVKAFKKYVPHEVVEQMSKNNAYNITLGGVKKSVACLFVDIRGFTKMSEELSPERIVDILNKYLKMVTEQIFKNGGMLDKYVGDAVMAVFNAPYDLEDYMFKACKTALDIVNEGKELQKEIFKETGKDLKYGIGVHIGNAIIGNIGCDFRMDFTAIGDTVNTAARLEANAQGNQILISEDLFYMINDRFNCELIGPIQFKNKQNPIVCYEILSMKEETDYEK